MSHYRVPVTHINEWFADVEAPNEAQAQHAAIEKARSWRDRAGHLINPHPGVGKPIQYFPETADVVVKPPGWPFISPPVGGPDHDPARDSRADAATLFNPSVVDISPQLRAAIRSRVQKRSTGDVWEAWAKCPWSHIQLIPTIGAHAQIIRDHDLAAALPHLGTAMVAYSAAREFVCRSYSAAFATVVTAELSANCGMIFDEGGHHAYSAVPTVLDDGSIGIRVVEPQADQIVTALDPARHYDGMRGFCILI